MWKYHDPYHPAADELYHSFKYIKRYPGADGKWRYVYADKNTHHRINNSFTYGEKNRQRGSNSIVATNKYNLDHTLNRDGSRLTVAQRRRLRGEALREVGRGKSQVQKAYNLVDTYDVRNQARRAASDISGKITRAAASFKRKANGAKSAISNRVKAKITTAVQKRARRRKGWNG